MNAGEDDIYSLLSWAEEEALDKALWISKHNPLIPRPKGLIPGFIWTLMWELCSEEIADYAELNVIRGRRLAAVELVVRIKNMRVSQRPHVEGGRV